MSELFPDSEQLMRVAIAEPNEANVQRFFKERLRETKGPFVHMEFGTIGAFSDFTDAITPEEAFEIIPSAVRIVKSWKGSVHIETALCFLVDCAESSKTTELPEELKLSWNEIEEDLRNQKLLDSIYWKGLKQWYRL